MFFLQKVTWPLSVITWSRIQLYDSATARQAFKIHKQSVLILSSHEGQIYTIKLQRKSELACPESTNIDSSNVIGTIKTSVVLTNKINADKRKKEFLSLCNRTCLFGGARLMIHKQCSQFSSATVICMSSNGCIGYAFAQF